MKRGRPLEGTGAHDGGEHVPARMTHPDDIAPSLADDARRVSLRLASIAYRLDDGSADVEFGAQVIGGAAADLVAALVRLAGRPGGE